MTPDQAIQQAREAIRVAFERHDEECRSQDYHTDGERLHPWYACAIVIAALDHYTALIRADERVKAQQHNHADGCPSPTRNVHPRCGWCKKQVASKAALQALITQGRDSVEEGTK